MAREGGGGRRLREESMTERHEEQTDPKLIMSGRSRRESILWRISSMRLDHIGGLRGGRGGRGGVFPSKSMASKL